MEQKTAERFEQLEARLLTVTDQIGGIIDMVEKRGYVPAFRCGHSGLHLPADYLLLWGRRYGIGLGSQPVSEVLDSDYYTAPPAVTPDIRDAEQIMHPVGPCMSQVDFLLVPPGQEEPAIMDWQDPGLRKRVKIVRQKQLVNPMSRLRVLLSKMQEVT